MPIPGRYQDAALVLDVQVVGTGPGRFVAVRCRASTTDGGGYQLTIFPATRACQLTRWDGDRPVVLSETQESPAIRRGDQWNHLEFRCVGPTLVALVNGAVLASAEDATHAAGTMWLGAGAADAAVAEAVFAGFLVVQQ